jgi:hypothetical protein
MVAIVSPYLVMVACGGAQIRFSRYDVVYVDESAEAISTLDVVWRR